MPEMQAANNDKYMEVLHEQDGSKKQPYYITFGEDSVMHMAALYDIWHTGDDGEVLATFTIMTTDSSQRLRWCAQTLQHALCDADLQMLSCSTYSKAVSAHY
jgi:putative SOS response-associated peptidase YedK